MHSRVRQLATCALVTVVTLGVASASLASPASAAPDDPTIAGLLAARSDNRHIGSDLAMLVLDAATGEVVYSIDPDALQMPASNMKIVTAVTTLAALGPEAQLTTRVRAMPTPNEIALQGGGDPMLTTSDLEQMAATAASSLDAAQPVVVHVDDDVFGSPERAPGWTTGYIPSVVSTVEGLARLYDYSSHPSSNAAKAFAKALRKLGFKAKVREEVDVDEAWPVLADHATKVKRAVDIMLNDSENNVAEALYRQVAIARGLPATWAGGREAARQVLADLGIDASGMALLDGSGLSRRDRVSPRFLADVLRMARVTNPAPFTAMFASEALPLSGRTGTLDDRYGRFTTKQSRCAQGLVHAKTGTLFDTIGLSGVASATSGGERIFSMLVNHRPQRFSALATRQALDGLAATITGCWS